MRVIYDIPFKMCGGKEGGGIKISPQYISSLNKSVSHIDNFVSNILWKKNVYKICKGQLLINMIRKSLLKFLHVLKYSQAIPNILSSFSVGHLP